ncbi:MAG: hypothetical protein F4Y86_13495 [Gammaproteobacteria bacterium]|nr:hypothetical protein [Gammaproteobacteria bacterium]MYB38177.1 hypothetical protein [Gammaproteobacteria bacterium]
MATPRKQLVDSEVACTYHVSSRCVRQSWLFGLDELTRKDYSYRKAWLTERLKVLATCFAIELYAYSIMSNHYHLVLRHDPKACEMWTDEEVAERWVEVYPPKGEGQALEERKAAARERLLGNPGRLAGARKTLGSLSGFMQHLNQPIARRANKEDERKGHFFEERFYSGALLSEEAVVAAMAYVDLNPVRAKIARDIEECADSSIGERLRECTAESLEEFLRPVASGVKSRDDCAVEASDEAPAVPETAPASRSKRTIGTKVESAERPASTRPDYPGPQRTLGEYVTVLRSLAAGYHLDLPPDKVSAWSVKVATIRRRQRAFGPLEHLKQWATVRGTPCRGIPLAT